MSETLKTLDHTAPQPPQGFTFNPEILSDYDEQVAVAIAEAEHQAKPVVSFEHVPTVDIVPTFNPTSAPENEIYASNRSPDSMRPRSAPHSEFTGSPSPVEMWRIVEREKVADGTGLVSSRILLGNSLGDVEGFDDVKHLTSNHARRTASPEAATPFISFSTDPENLAERVILRYGFGIKDGRDSIVVRVRVDPGRVVTQGKNKEAEVLAMGGIAPTEFVAAYEVSDFIKNVLPPDGVIDMVDGGSMSRDEALSHWSGTHNHVAIAA